LPPERPAMKTTMLIAALVFAGATPVLACDYHATHTTAAESSTAVVCDGSGCHALETSTAQQEKAAEPTVVAAQTDK
jgi:phosphoribosylaminoimidazole (AIR) synthetase